MKSDLGPEAERILKITSGDMMRVHDLLDRQLSVLQGRAQVLMSVAGIVITVTGFITFNTNMLKAGVDQTVMMKMTGHKTPAMFLRYSHLDKEVGETATGKLDQNLPSYSSCLRSIFRNGRLPMWAR